MHSFLAAAAATNDLPVWAAFAIIGGFLIIFPLFWCLVVLLISYVGDWHRLASTFAAGDRPLSGTPHHRVFGVVGLARYKFALTVHLAKDGFFVETSPLFRIGHPRLFIPWSAVSERSPRRFFRWETIVLTIGQPRIGTIALSLPPHELQPPQS